MQIKITVLEWKLFPISLSEMVYTVTSPWNKRTHNKSRKLNGFLRKAVSKGSMILLKNTKHFNLISNPQTSSFKIHFFGIFTSTNNSLWAVNQIHSHLSSSWQMYFKIQPLHSCLEDLGERGSGLDTGISVCSWKLNFHCHRLTCLLGFLQQTDLTK